MKREAHAHRCTDCREMYICPDMDCRGARPGLCLSCKAWYDERQQPLFDETAETINL